MTAYIVNIFLLIAFAILFFWYKPTLLQKKLFCILASIQLILLSALRDYSIGEDTLTYKWLFDSVTDQNWSNLWSDLINIIFKGAVGKDPGYSLFEKFIQIFTVNYHIYLLIVALIFTIPFGVWIYKNSKSPFISFLIYSCLFFPFFSITGIRQTIATALLVFIGYKFIKERRLVPFILLFAIAVTIHKSSICFLPFYFLANIKITKSYITIFSIGVPILFVMRNKIMIILGKVMGYTEYIRQYEGAGTWTFTTILVLLTIVTIWRHKVMIKNNPKVTHYINALFLAVAFTPLTFVDPSAMRVVQYFSVFIMLLIPEIIKSFKAKDRIFVLYGISALLIVLYLKDAPQYLFFWKG